LIRSWRKNISEAQIQKALKILNRFGLDMVYNDQDMPLLGHTE
jgi:hypothetical protein